jgi:hypothetical protein
LGIITPVARRVFRALCDEEHIMNGIVGAGPTKRYVDPLANLYMR